MPNTNSLNTTQNPQLKNINYSEQKQGQYQKTNQNPYQDHVKTKNSSETNKDIKKKLRIFLLSSLIFGLSYYFALKILQFVQLGDYFSPDLQLIYLSGLLLLLIIYLFSVLSVTWTNLNYLLNTCLPIALGVSVAGIRLPLNFIALVFFATFVLISVACFRATTQKQLLIKFAPRLYLGTAIKGVIFTFAVVGALIVIGSPKLVEKANIVERLSDLSKDQAKKYISNSGSSVLSVLSPQIIDEQIDNTFENQLKPQFDQIRRFSLPIIALIVFSGIQFLGYLVRVVFTVTVDALFWFTSIVKLTKKYRIEVEAEVVEL